MAKMFRTSFGSGVQLQLKPMPIGSFIIRIDEVDVAPSKASGNMTLYCNGEAISHGEEGHRVRFNVPLWSPDAMFRVGQLLVTSGAYTEEELVGDLEVDYSQLEGSEVGIVYEADTDNRGRPTTRVAMFVDPKEATGASGEDFKEAAQSSVKSNSGGLGSLL